MNTKSKNRKNRVLVLTQREENRRQFASLRCWNARLEVVISYFLAGTVFLRRSHFLVTYIFHFFLNLFKLLANRRLRSINGGGKSGDWGWQQPFTSCERRYASANDGTKCANDATGVSSNGVHLSGDAVQMECDGSSASGDAVQVEWVCIWASGDAVPVERVYFRLSGDAVHLE